MTISTIIPAYNAERYLAEAIESVLAQTRPPEEIVVVDDGSEDGTAEVASRFPQVRLVRKTNQGIGATLNRGVEETTGAVLTFLDADDLWVPAKLELQRQALEQGHELVFCHVEQFLSPELTEGSAPEGAMPGRVIGSLMVRRETFLRVGPLATRWTVGEFLDWLSRAQDLRLSIVTLPEVLLRRRLHTTNQGIRHHDARGDYARILKAALDRRRALEKENRRP